MTVGMDKLNNLFRDFKVAEDVAKMMEMRRFEVEYTMYGSMFLEDRKAKYIVSGQDDKVVSFMNNRKNFGKYPFPMMKHTVKTTVPSGAEEDIARMVKVDLAKIMRDSFSKEFLNDFYAVAFTPNDDAAKDILDDLQEKLYGVYRADNLLLFEGLMDLAYRAKHISEETCADYELWLEDEWHQMEDDPVLEDQFSKELYGFASMQNGNIKIHYNAEKAKVYDKRKVLERNGALVSQVYAKMYWYNYDKTLKDVRDEFELFLADLFDETYFSYLQRINALSPVVDVAKVRQLEANYGSNNSVIQNVIEVYKNYWRIHDRINAE